MTCYKFKLLASAEGFGLRIDILLPLSQEKDPYLEKMPKPWKKYFFNAVYRMLTKMYDLLEVQTSSFC